MPANTPMMSCTFTSYLAFSPFHVAIWFVIFKPCIFRSCNLLLQFRDLHFHTLEFWWSIIFTSCIFSQPQNSFVRAPYIKTRAHYTAIDYIPEQYEHSYCKTLLGDHTWSIELCQSLLISDYITFELIPPQSYASQRYNLRHRTPSLQLPSHTTRLSDSNFITRMLYKDKY